jgi:hypothetical protein
MWIVQAVCQTRKHENRITGKKLLLSSRLRRSDVFFSDVRIRPRAAQIEKLNFQESNHLHSRGKTTALKYSLMAVIILLILIVMTPIGIELAFMRVSRIWDNEWQKEA